MSNKVKLYKTSLGLCIPIAGIENLVWAIALRFTSSPVFATNMFLKYKNTYTYIT